MSNEQTFVIVGGGLGGAKGAEALREQGFDGDLVLLTGEADAPYERPGLSKGYLQGQDEHDSLYVGDADWAQTNKVDLHTATTVIAVTPAEHQVTLADGTSLHYDKLLLATGARPIALPVDGADADGVHYLRTFADSDALREALAHAKRAVIVGAGWIGLEVAAAARQAGVDVSVVEKAAAPLLSIVGAEIADVFTQLHRSHGVDFFFNATVESIGTTDGHVSFVRLADGTELLADLVVAAVGVTPAVELAERAGLDVDNGVRVDASLRTSDPDIYAVGDIANAEHPFLGHPIRVEHWAVALKQPKTAAAGMLGNASEYSDLPYFYTDQYDLSMEYVGYLDPTIQGQVVVRGSLTDRKFLAFWLVEGAVVAAMNVNIFDVTDDFKRIILSRDKIDPARLADESVPLASFGND